MVKIPVALSLATLAILAWHHLFYPALRRLPGRPRRPAGADRGFPVGLVLPRVVALVPAAAAPGGIAATVRSLAAVDYPARRLSVLVVCGSSGSDEAVLARSVAAEPACRHLLLQVLARPGRRSAAVLLSELLPTLDAELALLVEPGTLVPADALLVASRHLAEPRVGMVSGTCRPLDGRPARAAARGPDPGAPGGLHLIRCHLLRPLPPGTIDGMMTIRLELAERGYRAVRDRRIVALQLRPVTACGFARRCRAAAGRLQEVVRLRRLLHPRHGSLALAFASEEALQAVVPFAIALSLATSLAAAPSSPAAALPAGFLVLLYLTAALRRRLPGAAWPRPVGRLLALLDDHMAGLVGGTGYLLGLQRAGLAGSPFGPWSMRPAGGRAARARPSHIHGLVAVGKRSLDIAGALLLLLLTAPLFPVIAAAIKLDSPGPILFRQMRIGQSTQELTTLFHILKFRTMRADAEADTGAVLAARNDSRVTRVGSFLRRTRLDELPQLVNVLRGEMSLVGPRPERPGIFRWLDIAIPYYGERMYGVKPGITGFAQIVQGYDETIDDVRSKLNLDHAYALALSRPRAWLSLELTILARTLLVMLRRAGQ